MTAALPFVPSRPLTSAPTVVAGATTYPLPKLPARCEPRVDARGYHLPPVPGSNAPPPYTRATTVAKTLEERGGLTKWSLTQVLSGLTANPALLAGLDADADNTTIDHIAELAHDAAGAGDAAVFGTAVHAWAEAVDLGVCTIDDVPEELRRHVRAYRAACLASGLTVVPELVECVIYNAVTGAAGRVDRIMRDADGQLVIVDLKTSSNIKNSLMGIGIQLAQYATAAWLLDASGTRWLPFPDVRKDVAVVVHVPAQVDGEPYADVLDIDLGMGISNMHLAVEVLEARAS
ncbi:PD-(D/E)XK nuclease superfamily [Mycobacteroides abscessus]|uniref:PD-(D/E)XK nuclease family protein n=1 Tax=Mycobacteroides abscessus TaxID=36809 RepID=UPI0005DBB45E|nr:PD-(D/E)XK nuclease family protein [Mycobacteroides abscessus]CPX20547.1 PD-(D/E)XK nuclease superfamily [Mycobacteroides abscessus]